MTLDKAVLELPPVDVDGDGSDEVGVFHMAGDLEITVGTRTSPLVGGRSGTVNAVVGDAVDAGHSKHRRLSLDAGGGEHVVQIDFRGWEGATDADGDPLQWGASADPGVRTPASATGADPVVQMLVLDHYLQVATVDSETPATLSFGGYAPGELFDTADLGLDELAVVVESPRHNLTAADPGRYSGSLTCVETLDANAVVDAAARQEY